MTGLDKSILSTIVYYDVLGMPLTGFEVWKYLVNSEEKEGSQKPLGTAEAGSKEKQESQGIAMRAWTDVGDFFSPVKSPPSMRGEKKRGVALEDIISTLDSDELRRYISQKNGFYFLKGRDNLYGQRIKRKKISDQKWKKVRRIVKWFQAIPYIKMAAISGSLAQNNAKPESDFDLLVVAKKGRIWTARALVTLAAAMLGVRRHGPKTKDRICLNHYITDESLEIKFRSLYNAQTYAHLVCIEADSRGFSTRMYADFQRANLWIKNYLYFYPLAKNQNQRFIESSQFLKFFGKFGESLLDGGAGNQLEKFFRKIQLDHIEKHPLRHKKGGRIVADDLQLEFHPDSPEKEILEKYNKKMIQLGFPELGQEKDSGLS